MLVFSFCKRKPPFDLIDMFIKEPFAFDRIYKNRINVKIENITIPILPVNDLIKLKEKAGRPKDLDDIAQLKKIKEITGD